MRHGLRLHGYLDAIAIYIEMFTSSLSAAHHCSPSGNIMIHVVIPLLCWCTDVAGDSFFCQILCRSYL